MEAIILVPGIGLGGIELLLLARHLRQEGYQVTLFWKSPWRRSLAASATMLHEMITAHPQNVPHLVAHSLGGLVILQMLHNYPDQKVGRIVCLGSPLCGCLAARRVGKVPGGRWLIGEALSSVCSMPTLRVPAGYEMGSIAGRLNFLMGMFLCPHHANDTLVCVEETQHPDVSDHCVLPVSHSSMLFSKQVSRRIAHFLRNGCFFPD